MRNDLLNLLECPFCAAGLRLEAGPHHEQVGDEILTGILLCDCCAYPIVSGIPYLRTGREAEHAMKLLGAGRRAEALNVLLGLDEHAPESALTQADSFEATVALLKSGAEGRYLLYRFSDPTFLASEAVLTAVAAVFRNGKPLLDVCGGSGHLTRSLLRLQPAGGVVLADLVFWKLYLAKRFVAPECQPVCCNANDPLPFRRSAFAFASCTDAFHYIWSKRQLASEMVRVVDPAGSVVLAHLHNALSWNPSQGMPLPPNGYARLFPERTVRLFDERAFLKARLNGSDVDLGSSAPAQVLAEAAALVLLATPTDKEFRRLPQRTDASLHSFALNPLYVRCDAQAGTWRRCFPTQDYADEYAACMDYLPEEIQLTAGQWNRWRGGDRDVEFQSLIHQRVLLDLPDAYLAREHNPFPP